MSCGSFCIAETTQIAFLIKEQEIENNNDGYDAMDELTKYIVDEWQYKQANDIGGRRSAVDILICCCRCSYH